MDYGPDLQPGCFKSCFADTRAVLFPQQPHPTSQDSLLFFITSEGQERLTFALTHVLLRLCDNEADTS